MTLTKSDYLLKYVGATPPGSPKNTPFQNFITAYNSGSNNEQHISFETRNGNWFANELNSTPSGANCSFMCNSMSITGPATVCSTAATYTLNNAPIGSGISISWAASPVNAVSITPSPDGSSAQVSKSSGGRFTLNVTISSAACGSIMVSSSSTQAGGYGSADYPVSGPSSASCNQYLTFTTNTLPGATDYSWFYPSGWSYSSGQGTPSLTVRTPSSATTGNYQVGVRVANSCDAGGSPGIKNVYLSCGFGFYSISPNPATSEVTATVVQSSSSKAVTSSDENTPAVISELNIYDQQGNIKKKQKFGNVQQARINVSDLPVGIYFIEIVNGTYKERKQLSILK